jgi:hypothetical protein
MVGCHLLLFFNLKNLPRKPRLTISEDPLLGIGLLKLTLTDLNKLA